MAAKRGEPAQASPVRCSLVGRVRTDAASSAIAARSSVCIAEGKKTFDALHGEHARGLTARRSIPAGRFKIERLSRQMGAARSHPPRVSLKRAYLSLRGEREMHVVATMNARRSDQYVPGEFMSFRIEPRSRSEARSRGVDVLILVELI